MNIVKNILLFVFGVLLIMGCSKDEYMKQDSVFIVFKTPTIKHADLGFIYENTHKIKVEMYSNGQAVMALDINEETICMSLFECMDKKNFNKSVLSAFYPKNILQNIFSGKGIFHDQNRVNTRNGFTQKISKMNKYNIEYSVLNKQIIFRDTMNHILIKVKRVR